MRISRGSVYYCTDEFENDGSLASTILKNMKRVMAGDYSRQLSRRMFITQCRMTELGLWRGGSASYGLRRLLVDPNGRPITQLDRGQRKSISTERVVLMPGPAEEITTVKRIFRSFVSGGKSYTEIADALNNDKITNGLGRPWSTQGIIHILSNETYIGNAVFNRTSFKLKQKAVTNPPDMWIRHANAHQAIIAPEIFQKAQKIIAKRRERRSDQELLDLLSALWTGKGHLSSRVMEADEKIPHMSVYVDRFGSLRAAYARIGFEPKRRFQWVGIEAEMTLITDAAVAEIVRRIAELGGTASFEPRSRSLSIGQTFTVTIGSARCICVGVGRRRWHVRVNRRATTDLTLIFRMDTGNKRILDYYLIATADLLASSVDRFQTTSLAFRKATQHDNLGAFYRIDQAALFEADGKQILVDLKDRLLQFGLSLHEGKTRLIEFGRFAAHERTAAGQRRPETFDFLGFTHYCAKTRKNKFMVKRKTQAKRLARKLKAIREEMKHRMHALLREQHRWLRQVLNGHYQYFGVIFNYRSRVFKACVVKDWRKVLGKRSQKGCINWANYRQLLIAFPLPER